MNIFLRLMIIDRYLWTNADSFCNFLFFNWWENQAQSFSLILWNHLLILKILPITGFNDPTTAVLTLKMLTGSHLWLCKIILEAACDMSILSHFSCSQWEVGTREQWLGWFQYALSKLVSNFKEANKKLIFVYSKTSNAYTESTD
jgi:hypothetical protein